ncbi:MAG: YdcF family protein [Steroidobacteraceae bacterium]
MTGLELRVLAKALILPPAGPLIVGVAGLLLCLRRPRLGFALCAVAIGGLWLFATPIVADKLARATEAYPALDPTHLTQMQARAQAIVILGGGVRRGAPEVGGDAPSVTGDLRLIEGAKVARATHLPILISGSALEANAMRDFLAADLGIPARWVETASTDTHDNAVFSARLLAAQDINRIILVTSSAHMARAVDEFTAAGLEVTAAPAEMWTWDERGPLRFVPSMAALDRSRTGLYEWAGRMVRTLKR